MVYMFLYNGLQVRTNTEETGMGYSASRTEISTYSGRYVDLADPQPESFVIEDIARGLSNTCRFGGQCNEFYSVAQHSVLVSHLVPKEHQLAALLHDSSEAYCPDLQTPLKKMLPEFKEIEKKVEAAIFRKFGIPFPLHASVKVADLKALATERRDVTQWGKDFWPLLGDIEPLPIRIDPLSAKQAYSAFMDRFYELADSIIFENSVLLG
jgi:5'-deoxynucleotidase YfbR-like HD superfamily hydrolase